MQFRQSLFASLLMTAAFVAPAWGQADTSDDVIVNSGAVGRGYLLYPGGNYARAVRPLLQPGEKPGQVIHLHMPTHRRVVSSDTPAHVASLPAAEIAPRATRTKPAAPVTTDTAALPEDSAARLVVGGTSTAAVTLPKPPARPARSAAPAPSATTGATTVPFSFSGAPVAAPSPPTRTASATPPARTTPSAAAGLKRQTVIPFTSGASSLAPADVNSIHTLAASLTAALSSTTTRVELAAFAGPRGDKSSDSRRLSLKRALVVRELLIEDGVPSERIDVRAMGGADDSGATDRVDVFLRS